MSPRAKRRGRAGWNRRTASKLIAANDETIVPVPVSPWLKLEPAWAILFADSSGRRSRRLYLSLHSASAAVARAEARGVNATLVLCRIVPVEAIGGDSQ